MKPTNHSKVTEEDVNYVAQEIWKQFRIVGLDFYGRIYSAGLPLHGNVYMSAFGKIKVNIPTKENAEGTFVVKFKLNEKFER